MKKKTNAIFELDNIQTQLESAASLLYAVYEAMLHEDLPQKDNANAVWGVWNYLTDLLEESGKLICAGCEESGTDATSAAILRRLLQMTEEERLIVLQFVSAKR